MIRLLLFIFAAGLPSSLHGQDTSSFFKWWETTAYTAADDQSPSGVIARHVTLLQLKEFIYPSNSADRIGGTGNFKFFRLWSDSALTIVLAVGRDSTTNFSLIRSYPGGQWSQIDLRPYTSDCYGPDEVDFTLFWLPQEDYPYIEVVTNGPACVPVDLLKFDPQLQTFQVVRHLCGA